MSEALSYRQPIYTYYEALSDRCQSSVPEVLSFRENLSPEAVLFRLLLGTINVKQNFEENVIRQRGNYANLPFTTVRRLSQRSLEDSRVPVLDGSFNKYLRQNRKNSCVFEQVLYEFSSYFYQVSLLHN